MATDYTDLGRAYAVLGSDLARALEEWARKWIPPLNAERRAAELLEAAEAVPVADWTAEGNEPGGIRVGREAALAAIGRVLRGLANGTDITDEAVAEEILAALEEAGAVEAHADGEDRCTANSRKGGPEPSRCTKDAGHVGRGDPGHVNRLKERWTSTEKNPTVTMPVRPDEEPAGNGETCPRVSKGGSPCVRYPGHPGDHKAPEGGTWATGGPLDGGSILAAPDDEEPGIVPAQSDAETFMGSVRNGTRLMVDDDEDKGDPNADEVAAFAAAWNAIAGIDAGAAERVLIHVAGMLGADVSF